MFEVFVYSNGSLVSSEYFNTQDAAKTEYNKMIAKHGNNYRSSVCVYCPGQCKMYAEFRNF